MSRVRTLVDYQSQISDFDGDGTRDLNINGSITAGGLTSPDVPKVDLTIAPEVLEIQVDAPAAGQDTAWLWTWEQSTLPYARRTITNSPEVSVPLYKQGQYVVNNFAAYDVHGSMTQTHTLYFKWIDGAGTDNLISWATSTGPISDTHPDINGGTATDVQRITVNVPATVTPPTLTAPNVSYTVTNNGSGAYTFSGSAAGDNPNLGPIYRGGTYTFNINASGHPLYLTTDNGTNFSAGTYFGEYTTGVTGSRTDSGTLTITVDANAPDTLYYQCGNHSSMRGAIIIKDLAVETNINGNYVVYAMHTQEGHKTPVELRPIPSLVNQMCIVYDNSVNKFVPQDLATYVENTPSFENKIREVAGTAELVVEDGSAVVAKVNVYDDSTYLPLTGNNPGDQAFATDTDILYIWDGSAWQQAGAANTDDLAEGTTNLFYTDARVGTYLSSNGYDTATNIVASITDSAPATLDTLNELAAALGDDPNFATTTANNIALKAPINNPNFTGNVGIGTTSPTGDLEIKNDAPSSNTAVVIHNNSASHAAMFKARAERASGNQDVSQFLTDNAGKTITNIRGVTDTSSTSGRLEFWTAPSGSNAQVRMTVDDAGNVGIGTTGPSASYTPTLHVYGSNPNLHLQGTNTGSWAYFELENTNYDRAFGMATNGSFRITDDNSTLDTGIQLELTQGGNLGVGVSNPSRQLHIFDSGRAGGYRLLVEGDNSHTGIEIKNQAASNTNILFRNPSWTQEIYMGSDGTLYVGYDSVGEPAIQIAPHSADYHKYVRIHNSHYLRQNNNYKKVLYKSAGSSSATHRIARMRKHYWGSGTLKLEIHRTYYTSYQHGVFICDGHTRHSHSPYVSVRTISNNNGCPTPYWGSIVNVSQEEGYADLYIDVPAYYGYVIVCEVNAANVVEDDDMYTGVSANIFYLDG